MLLRFIIIVVVFFVGQIVVLTQESNVTARKPCRIEVREQGTNILVPLVELRTTHQQRFVTDNAGVIALDSPELIGRETWFNVNGYGYSVKQDGFGMSGVRLIPEYGKTLRVDVQRDIVAKRLGRLTGAGCFAESQKLGEYTQIPETGVFGCDSVQNAVYNGRLFWIWGDTTLAHYPLGIFHATAATTDIAPFSAQVVLKSLKLDTQTQQQEAVVQRRNLSLKLEPPLFLAYQYFTDATEKPRGVAVMSGDKPTWLSGCVVLPDKKGTQRLVAVYAKIHPPLEVYEYGLCVWNDAKKSFEHLRTIWAKKQDSRSTKPIVPEGHAVLWRDKQGKCWVLFGDPFPRLRCPATYEAWQNPDQWETLTPQNQLLSASDNSPIIPHSGSIAWNTFRQCWVTVFTQKFGKPTAFGEVWYAESDEPTGHWGNAVKILSHGNYTFYNPCIHAESFSQDSQILLFEGTFAAMFADNPPLVPRYDYTQILYRLDLNDSALAAAQKNKK
ncbi:MAG: hypothetical protein LBJ00_06915 [Planctomycetaceae bacterium]|jgi:hypothetical protein|nr:hypothetical protein [Planctomycetaceae bacterium]